jgi:hypothetical protein
MIATFIFHDSGRGKPEAAIVKSLAFLPEKYLSIADGGVSLMSRPDLSAVQDRLLARYVEILRSDRLSA